MGSAVVLPTPAAAHPHVWIDVRIEVVYDDEARATGMRQTWMFDEYYSAFVVDGMDKDGDGTPDQDELDAWLGEVMGNLEEYNYYTEVTAGRSKVEFLRATGLSAAMPDLHVRIAFEAEFVAPITEQRLIYAVFDPTYYIDILHAEGDGVIQLVDAPEACGFDVIQPDPDPDLVAFAASLDVTQSGGDDLGALFAERVVVDCEPAS